MIIERIELEGIACYERQSFDFSNMAVVCGENRSGKSTLVYALYFGLFGAHLNPSLSPADLCRKGFADGSVTVFYRENGERFRLRRSIAGAPVLRRFCHENPQDPWQTALPDGAKTTDAPVGVPAQVATLTSFFQEGELLLFLKEMPKHNRTLLQHIVRMDEIFIVQSRFKRCFGLAREIHSRTEKKLSAEFVDMGRMSAVSETVSALEKELSDLEREHQALIRADTGKPDPEVFLKLKRGYEVADREARKLLESKERQVPFEQLAVQKAQFESQIARNTMQETDKIRLQNQVAAFAARIGDATAQLERLSSLGDVPACPTCGQAIPRERLAESTQRVKDRLGKLEAQKAAAEKALGELNERYAALLEAQKRLEETRIQMETSVRQNKEYLRLEERTIEAREALALFERAHPGNHPDPQARLAGIRESESRIATLRRQLIDAKVTLAQYGEIEKRRLQREAALNTLDRERLVCQVAYRAIEDAVEALNRDWMGRVRESLSRWTGHFSFLEEFDIGLTPNQLSPIVQAKGYSYKLNQMSKSERIFLYLMLKLAIGDALSHLGVFILDDPADGLDTKRKRMMAELLKEISQERQVLLTTNDPGFAEQFASQMRIDLPS